MSSRWKNEWMNRKKQEAHQEAFAIFLLRNQQDTNFGKSNEYTKWICMDAKDIKDKKSTGFLNKL